MPDLHDDPTAELAEYVTPSGKALKEPCKVTVRGCRSRYRDYVQQDSERSRARSKIDGLFDGLPPQDSRMLRAQGRGGEFNVNLGTAQQALDEAQSGYIDLINSLQNLVAPSVKVPDQAERFRVETRLAVHATHAFRNWPDFHANYLRLTGQYLKHGVGFALLSDPDNFRWRVMGFDCLFMPQQTPASPDAVEEVFIRESIPVGQLFSFIERESSATASGWNPEAVKSAILAADTSRQRYDEANWEAVQREIKNNDLHDSVQYKNVKIVWHVRKEPGGKYSLYCFLDAPPVDRRGKEMENEEFLLSLPGKYKRLTDLLVPFCYGTGNGTYHSIRGLGQRIFPLVQAYNRLYCTAMNGAMLGAGVMIQPDGPRSRMGLQFQQVGPLLVMPENVKFVERSMPNLAQSILPFVQDLDQRLNDNLDFYSTKGAASGSPYRSRLQVEAEIAAATRLTSANLSLFYTSWHILIREMFRRLVTGDKSDPIIADFHARCAEDGITPEMMEAIDFDRCMAVRAVGGGSASNRVAALGRIWQYASQFDPMGRQNLLFDTVAAELNHDSATRYVQATVEPRPTPERKMAELENSELLRGTAVPVYPNEMHTEHLIAHLPRLQEFVVAIDEGQVDAMEVLQGLTLLYQHAAEHAQFVSSDPYAGAIASQARAILQRSGQQILNYTRRAQAEAQQAAQDGGQGEVSQADQLKLQHEQFRMEHERTMAELEIQKAQMQIQRDAQAAAQKMALIDAQQSSQIALRTSGF